MEELVALSHSEGTKTPQMNNYTQDSANIPQSISMKDQSLSINYIKHDHFQHIGPPTDQSSEIQS